MSPRACDGALRKFAILERFYAFQRERGLRMKAAMVAFAVEENQKLGNLKRWHPAYQRDGLAGLVDRRRGIGKIKGERERALVDQIITRPKISGAQHLILLSDEHDVSDISLGTIRRYVKRWKEENGELLRRVNSSREWHDRHRGAVRGARSSDICRFGQRIEIDATPGDHRFIDGSRGVIIAAIDIYSRIGRVLVARTTTSAGVSVLLRNWFDEFGLPEEIHGDNGSEFISVHTQRVLADLHIPWIPSTAYSPWQKGHIERFNRTISHGALPFLPGFIGHNPKEQNEIRDRFTMAQRRGKTEAEILGANLTPEDLQRFLDQWLRTIYGESKHSMLKGKTPNQMVREWRGELRMVNPRALDLLLAPMPKGETRRVVKMGISVDGGYFYSAALAEYEGRDVLPFYDPDDAGCLVVYSLDRKFIGIAKNPERAGIDHRELAAELHSAQREEKIKSDRLKKRARQIKPHMMLQRVMDRRARDAKPLITDDDPRIVNYSTPELDAHGRAALALDAPAPAISIADHRSSSEQEDPCISDRELLALYLWTDGKEADREIANWRAEFEKQSKADIEAERRWPRFKTEEIDALAIRVPKQLGWKWGER